MKIIKTFSKRVKASRKHIFENIMDLDHVCSVHKKWFRKLRIREERPDYVEYDLESWFYGFKQKITAKGGPVDQDSYWYEFNGKIAKIRVEGTLDGKDGDLLQTERIIYCFKWFWYPAFFLLSPVFKIQKDDILRDDTQLLERRYSLEQEGFQPMDTLSKKATVVVYGGSGFFGRMVVEDLLKYSDLKVVIASRDPTVLGFGLNSPRVKYWISDIEDKDSIKRTIANASVVINCMGPFQGMKMNLLDECIERKINYVDAADDCDFVMRCFEKKGTIEEAGIKALIGCSVVPGMSSVMMREGKRRMPDANQSGIFISPGTRFARGVGSFLCLLNTVAQEYEIPSAGSTRTVTGWTERTKVHFPPPVGQRFTYTIVNIGDYFIAPKYLGIPSVTFKIGSEMDFLNRGLELYRVFKRVFGVKNDLLFVPIFRKIIGFFGLFGTTQAGMMVKMSKTEDNIELGDWLSIYTGEGGEVIPSIFPSLAVQMLISNEIEESGFVDPSNWITFDRFKNELNKRGVKVAYKDGQSEVWKDL